MTIKGLQLVAASAALFACSPPTTGGNAGAAERTQEPPRTVAGAPTVERPADAPDAGIDAIMGAVPGPCGSGEATEFMGRSYSPEVEAALKARTGASEINIVDHDGADANLPPDPRRLNVLLNSRQQIILLDCG
jgi:hypothetical protein